MRSTIKYISVCLLIGFLFIGGASQCQQEPIQAVDIDSLLTARLGDIYGILADQGAEIDSLRDILGDLERIHSMTRSIQIDLSQRLGVIESSIFIDSVSCAWRWDKQDADSFRVQLWDADRDTLFKTVFVVPCEVTANVPVNTLIMPTVSAFRNAVESGPTQIIGFGGPGFSKKGIK